MKKNFTPLIIILSVTALLIIAFLWYISLGKGSLYWETSFLPEDKNPYGTYVLNQLIRDRYDDGGYHEIFEPLEYTFLNLDSSQPSNYLYVGKENHCDWTDAEALFEFVSSGNQAIIFAEYFSDAILEKFDESGCLEEMINFKLSTNIDVNFQPDYLKNEEDFTFYHRIRNDTVSYYWKYFSFASNTCLEDNYLVEMGYFNDSYTNVISMDYGKGRITLNSAPLTLTNLYLKDKNNLNYIKRSLADLGPGNLYWDEYSRYEHYYDDRSQLSQSNSPMQYILSKPGLKWAWYLLIATLLLFMIFRSKRKQRIIPVIEPPSNTSFEYIETIGALYFQQQDHRKLALKQMKNIKSYIRRHYNLAIRDYDQKTAEKVAVKANVPVHVVIKLFKEYQFIEKSNSISDERLISFNYLLNHLYQNQ